MSRRRAKGQQSRRATDADAAAVAALVPGLVPSAAAERRATFVLDGPHGVTGLLVPARDDVALASAMLRLGEHADLRHRCGVAARARAVAHFGIAQVVRETFRVYEAALAA